MRTLLIVLSVLVIILPIIIIVQSLFGFQWIKTSDYFWMVLGYIFLLIIYFDTKKKTHTNKEK